MRIFNTYGPRMALDDGRVVSNFVAQALTGTPLTIYGHGEQTRSFQYVSDLIEGTPYICHLAFCPCGSQLTLLPGSLRCPLELAFLQALVPSRACERQHGLNTAALFCAHEATCEDASCA